MILTAPVNDLKDRHSTNSGSKVIGHHKNDVLLLLFLLSRNKLFRRQDTPLSVPEVALQQRQPSSRQSRYKPWSTRVVHVRGFLPHVYNTLAQLVAVLFNKAATEDDQRNVALLGLECAHDCGLKSLC